MDLRRCEYCDAPIPDERGQGRRRALVRYCSSRCVKRASAERNGYSFKGLDPRPCKECGAVFTPGSPAAKFCGRKCARRDCARHERSLRRSVKGLDVSRDCRECGAAFLPARQASWYCSDTCGDRGRSRSGWAKKRSMALAERHRCQGCLEYFTSATRADQKYCTADCRRQAQALRDRLRRYGLEIHDYRALLRDQSGACAICRVPEDRCDRSLAIDHDHQCCPGETSCGGCVRGLLCGACNIALGRYERVGFFPDSFASYLAAQRPRQLRLA